MHLMNWFYGTIPGGDNEEGGIRWPWTNKTIVRFLLLALAAYFTSNVAHAQPSPFRFLQKPGAYAVGLKVVDQYDPSREFGSGHRPVQTLVWYPASHATGKRMTVGEYARLAETVTNFTHPDKHNDWVTRLAASAGVQLRAVRGAALANGHFPVMVYAPGKSSVAWDNADLCEYIASHGYVVLASSSVGKSPGDVNMDLGDIDAQARDISFLVSYAETLPDTDLSKVAVAGWSMGGLSNLFAAEHDSRIKALVAYDGSMRYFPALVKEAGIRPEKMTLPLLFFTQGYLSLEDWDAHATAVNKGPSVLNEWTHGDLWTVHMLGMSHLEFSSMFQRTENDQKFAKNQMVDYGREDVNVGYAWVARYTLAFLNAYLKGDISARAFLKNTPGKNGVQKHFMWLRFRPAVPSR